MEERKNTAPDGDRVHFWLDCSLRQLEIRECCCFPDAWLTLTTVEFVWGEEACSQLPHAVFWHILPVLSLECAVIIFQLLPEAQVCWAFAALEL